MARLTIWVLGLWLCAAGWAFDQPVGESSEQSLQAMRYSPSVQMVSAYDPWRGHGPLAHRD